MKDRRQKKDKKILNNEETNESSLYEENNTFHVSTACLTLDLKHKEILVNYFLKYIKRFNPGSIIALSEGTDQGIFDLSSIIRYKSQKPYFYFNLDDPGDPMDVSSILSDCMLFIPYLSNNNHFLNYLKFIGNYGAIPKLVICIFRETQEDIEGICKNKHINFQTLFYVKDIYFN